MKNRAFPISTQSVNQPSLIVRENGLYRHPAGCEQPNTWVIQPGRSEVPCTFLRSGSAPTKTAPRVEMPVPDLSRAGLSDLHVGEDESNFQDLFPMNFDRISDLQTKKLDVGTLAAENATSFASPYAKGATQQVQIRSIVECIHELEIDQIDLMKINIEGGEFDVLPAIIKSGDIRKVQYLQVQFHNFVPQATKQRAAICAQLENTHSEMWNYKFLWESWKLKRQVH